ncbi:acyl carrier protein [Actinomadura terrae]|uniref:acyl carrier protein n=1 Tax=Actinomadura terrae TaxID=604353 RepID=UPI001FA810EF|nr:acyl carrier protein [Actinomadura terrae]
MDIEGTIKNVLIDELFVDVRPEEIGLDDGLRATVGLDSLGFTELRVECENRFGVTISDEDFVPENFTSIRSLSELIRRLRKESATSDA